MRGHQQLPGLRESALDGDKAKEVFDDLLEITRSKVAKKPIATRLKHFVAGKVPKRKNVAIGVAKTGTKQLLSLVPVVGPALQTVAGIGIEQGISRARKGLAQQNSNARNFQSLEDPDKAHIKVLCADESLRKLDEKRKKVIDWQRKLSQPVLIQQRADIANHLYSVLSYQEKLMKLAAISGEIARVATHTNERAEEDLATFDQHFGALCEKMVELLKGGSAEEIEALEATMDGLMGHD